MELQELKQKILDNNIPNLLIFVGNEIALIDIYLNKIKELKNNNYYHLTQIIQYINNNKLKQLIQLEDTITIIRNDNDFLHQENLWQQINFKNKYLILIYNKLDEKLKFYKFFKNNIIEFNKLNNNIIKASLKHKLETNYIKLDDRFIDWLITICNSDYNRCLNELEKILIFKDDKYDFNILFDKLIKENLFFQEINENIFDFSNAILDRNKIKSLEYNEDFKQLGTNSIQILSILYNSFKNLILVQTSTNPTEQSTGLKENQIKAINYRKGKYSSKELINILKLIIDIDYKIKLGQIDNSIAIDYLLTRVL